MATHEVIPYELIGKATVLVVVIAIVILIAFALLVAFLFVWVRFWGQVVNLAWRGYDPLEGDKPPWWRRRISIVAMGFHLLKRPSNIHERVKEVHRNEY